MGLLNALLWFPGLTLVVCFLSALYYFLRKPAGSPPGPCYGLPLVGYVPFLGKYPWHGFRDLSVKYGSPIISLFMGNQFAVVLNDFNTMEQAMVKQGEEFMGRPYQFLTREFCRARDGGVYGLLALEPPKYQAVYQFIVKAFHDLGVNDKAVDKLIVTEMTELNRYLEGLGGQPFRWKDVVQAATFNIALRLLISRRIDYGDPEFKRVTSSHSKTFEAMAGNPIQQYPWLRFLPIPGLADRYASVRETVQMEFELFEPDLDDHEETYKEGQLRDFLDVWIRSQREKKPVEGIKSREQLLANMVGVHLAAAESPCDSLDWCMLHMVKSPDVQRKVQEELDSLYSPTDDVSYLDRSRLPYADACMREFMRVGGAAPLAIPHATLVETELCGYRIPARTTVFTNFWAARNDPKGPYGPDVDTFRPERHLDPDGSLKPERYSPWNEGPRHCPGKDWANMMIFTIFINILHKFEWRPAPGQGPLPPNDEYLVGLSSPPLPYLVTCSKRYK